MSKDEALKLIDRVLTAYKGTRQEHLLLQEAYQLIEGLVNPPKEKEEKK